MSYCCFYCECYGDHRDLHVLTHSFPTRRSSDLERPLAVVAVEQPAQRTRQHALDAVDAVAAGDQRADRAQQRSEEHTSELQSLMRISYAVFCLKKNKHYQK